MHPFDEENSSTLTQGSSNSSDELKSELCKRSFLDLPEELRWYICSFFNHRELALFGRVSRATYGLSREPLLWHRAMWPERDYLKVLPKHIVKLMLADGDSKGINFPKHISCLAKLSTDLIISGSADNTIKIWNIKTGLCELILNGHSNGVTFVAKLSETEIVSASGLDSEIRVWNLSTGNCVKLIQTNSHLPMCGLVLSSHEIITGSQNISKNRKYGDSTLCIWDLDIGKHRTLKGHTNTVSCLVKSSDETVISGSWDRTIRVWNWKKDECLETLSIDNDDLSGFNSVVEAHDGKIVCCDDSTIYIWDRKSTPPRKIQIECEERLPLNAIACLPNGNILSIGGVRSCIWDIESGELLNEIANDADLESVLVVDDGRIATGNATGMIDIQAFAFLESNEPELNNDSCSMSL